MGQASAYLSGEDIEWFLNHVDVLTLSSYEWDVLKQKTGLDIKSVAKKLAAVIITQGDKGAQLFANGDSDYFPALTLTGPTYPVGCGDAFRGGLLRGLSLQWDWTDALRLATLMGAIRLNHPRLKATLLLQMKLRAVSSAHSVRQLICKTKTKRLRNNPVRVVLPNRAKR